LQKQAVGQQEAGQQDVLATVTIKIGDRLTTALLVVGMSSDQTAGCSDVSKFNGRQAGTSAQHNGQRQTDERK